MTNLNVVSEGKNKKYIVSYTVEEGSAEGKLIQSVFSSFEEAVEYMEITRKGGSLLFANI
ncbi:hypothetical protein [Salirhabdus salicampi]|uniref:hypothetical protein n=1 Tax=Salirhabdus salicampi TaxID=476102 RepID=UPI0020C233FF|nr:hypothetical protein [Salirhabdus salicampi]MCP8615234.1 hypothetical protein [Salirhabdus salicampi]